MSGDTDNRTVPRIQPAIQKPSRFSDMAAILDVLHVERAVIGGLSLGGYLSLAFNVAYPERVSALMLFDTGPGYRKDEPPREDWNEMARGRARFFRRRGTEGQLPKNTLLMVTSTAAQRVWHWPRRVSCSSTTPA